MNIAVSEHLETLMIVGNSARNMIITYTVKRKLERQIWTADCEATLPKGSLANEWVT